MSGRAVSKISVAFAVVLSLMLLAGPVPASAEKSTDDKFQPLTSCMREKSSSWLFLMDTSKSLRAPGVDPDDGRVDALSDLLKDLNRKFSDSEIYVEILEFGSTVRRAHGLEGDYWQSLDDRREGMFLDVVERLRTQDADRHTDYLRALRPGYNPARKAVAEDLGVIELFEKQDKDTCQVLVWFSDGELSLEKDYVSHGLPLTFTAGDIADYDLELGDKKLEELSAKERRLRVKKVLGQNEVALLKELCRPRGPVDVLRGKGVAGLGTGEATFIVTVGLGESGRFGVLQAIAEGDTEEKLTTHHGALEGSKTCGSEPGLGIYLNTKTVKDLPKVFADVSAGRDTKLCGDEDECSERVEFQISPAMTYFSGLLDAGPGVNVTLEGPRGGPEDRYPLGTSRRPRETLDGRLDVDAPEGKNIRVYVTSPAAGEWAIVFDQKHPDNWVQLIPTGTLAPRLVGQFAEEGKPLSLTFGLNTQDAAQDALTEDELGDENLELDLQVRVGPEGSSNKPLLKEDEEQRTKSGTRNFRGDDQLESNKPLECEVWLEAKYHYSPDTEPLTLGIPSWKPCKGEGIEIGGILEVRDRATFPTLCDPGTHIELDGFFDASKSRNVLEHELCFVAGPEGAGTVCHVPSVQQTKSIVNEIAVQGEACLILKNGESGSFVVEFSADQQELNQDFLLKKEDGKEKEESFLRLEVRFHSGNSEGVSETYTVPYEAVISHETTTVKNWFKILLYILASLLLPLLLLYAYNFFWGSRFTKTGPLQRADVNVVVRNGQLFSAQGMGPIVNAQDFGPHAGVRSRSRTFQIIGEVGQVAKLTGRMPKLPHNEPWADGRFQDGTTRYVLSEQGTSTDSTAGRLSPSAAPVWLLGVSVADGDSSRLSEDWQGRLLVVLPSGTGKPAEASFEELLPQINRVLDEHNEALHEWQNALAVESEEPASDGGLGPDLATPPESSMPQLPGDEFPKPNNFPEIPE